MHSCLLQLRSFPLLHLGPPLLLSEDHQSGMKASVSVYIDIGTRAQARLSVKETQDD
jgi:hypothetical protein